TWKFGSEKPNAVELKAWVSEKVIWEFRRLYSVLTPERTKLDLRKVVYRHKAEWEVLWRSYGVSVSEAFYPNRHSLERRGKPVSVDTHEEDGLTTIAALALLTDCALYRKRKKDRDHSQAFLNALVAALLPSEAVREPEEFLATTRGCRNEPRCLCMDGLKTEMESCSSWGWCLVESKKAGLSCSAVNVVHVHMLRSLADMLARATAALPPADMSKCLKLWGIKKRLRLDEDLKRHFVSDGVQAGAFRSASQGVRQATVISISSDGKRLGQPAEETTVYAAWNADCDLAAWLPPMVSKDFHGGPAVDGDMEMLKAYQQEYKNHTARFFQQSEAAEPDAKKQKTQTLQRLKQAKLPNKDWGC
ncbi:unnamed protein product, partial [Symbiodinium necroappetens]